MRRTHLAVFSASAPKDDLSAEDQPRPLLPGGRWLFDVIVPALGRSGFSVPAVMPTSSGYWVLALQGARRRFDLIVSDIAPVFVCEIVECRSLVEWLRGSPVDPQFNIAFSVVCDAIRADARVDEVLTFSGPKDQGDVFVGQAMERLERKLGIYSR